MFIYTGLILHNKTIQEMIMITFIEKISSTTFRIIAHSVTNSSKKNLLYQMNETDSEIKDEDGRVWDVLFTEKDFSTK